MATITGKTAAAMDEIADASVVTGTVNGSGHLILTTHGGDDVDAGNVKGATGATGAKGDTGDAGADGTTLAINAIAAAHATTADWSNSSHKITSVTKGTTAGDVTVVGQVALSDDGVVFSKAVVEKAVNLTFATTITVDASLGNTFRVTLTASTGTLGAPSNPADNQKIIFEVKQDGTGTRTLAYNAAYEFTTDNPSPTLTTTANKVDELIFIYNSSSGKWRFQGALRGYS